MRRRVRTLYNHENIPGCVDRRRCRQTNGYVRVYCNPQAEIHSRDTWSVFCEEHNTRKDFSTIGLATISAAVPQEWCPHCADKVQQGNGN